MKKILTNRTKWVATVLFAAFFIQTSLFAQSTWTGLGANNNWTNADNWDVAPTSTSDVIFDGVTTTVVFTGNAASATVNSISLMNGADITFNPSGANRVVAILDGELSIDATSKLTVEGINDGIDRNITLRFENGGIDETADISGSLIILASGGAGQITQNQAIFTFNAGSVYEHRRNGGGVPVGTWHLTSTCGIYGRLGTAISNLDQTFGNLIWDCPNQSSNQSFPTGTGTLEVLGHFQLISTGANALNLAQASVSISNYTQTGGVFNCNANGRILTVTNNFNFTNGEFQLRANNQLQIVGNYTQTGGNLARIAGAPFVAFTGNTNQIFNFGGTAIVSGNVNFNVMSGATLEMANATTIVPGAGTFDLQGGSSLVIKSTEGIAASGATGHIQTTNRVFSTTANYFYQATGASTSGTGLPAQVNDLTVASGTNLTLSNSIAVNGTFTNDGEVIFRNGVALNSTSAIAGTGNVTLRRDFSTSHAWYRLGFATTTGTVADLVANFPIRTTTTHANPNFWNVYRWDAGNATTPSNWAACASTTPLNGTAFSIFAFGSDLYVQITRPNAELNQTTLNQVLEYNDGQSSPVLSGATPETEGWNMHYNPFQAYLDWDLVEPVLIGPNFTNSGVAVQNNLGVYEYYNANVGTARFIAPFQSFYIQTASTGTYPSTLSYTTAMTTTTPGTAVSTFKTAPINNFTLVASGPGGDVKTHLAENTGATANYDAAYDMRWFEGAGAAFYSSDANGTKYGIQQSDVLTSTLVPVVFSHPTNGAQFIISADLSEWDANIRVFLRDNFTNKKMRITKNFAYAFTNNTAVTGTRFTVSFVVPASSKSESDLEIDGIAAWFTDNTLNLYSEGGEKNGTVEVYNIAGQRLATQTFDTLENVNLQVSATGILIVRVLFNDGSLETIKVPKF
jgi:hypothetical protein